VLPFSGSTVRLQAHGRRRPKREWTDNFFVSTLSTMLFNTTTFSKTGAMSVPLLDLKLQNLALEPELQAAFDRVLRSGHFILGSEVEAFERAVADFIGARHAIGVSSGTDAILLALMALGIGPGDEVICPSFTFFATAGCVARLGAVPVLVDSCESDFNLDPADVERRLTPKTKAIIPVHLFGQAAEMDPIIDLAREKRLHVIEDAAQSFGADYHGRQVGTIGAFGAFSFFPSKNLGGFGDAGMLVCQDDSLAEKARILRTHGAQPKYFHKLIGGNFRIDALQAALLRVKLPHYSEYTAKRKANAEFYSERLKNVVTGSSSSRVRTVRLVLPFVHPGRGHIWNQYTLRVMPGPGRWQGKASPRDALREHLASKGIGSEIYYPLALHEQECFRYLTIERPDGASRGAFPVASRLARESLSIPIFPELTREQQEEVLAAVAEFVERH